MSVYVVELAGKVAMSLKPEVACRLRLTTTLFSLLELSVQARLTLLEETLVAVRLLGGTNPAHAPAASVKLRIIENNSLASESCGIRPDRSSLKEVARRYESSMNFFDCKCIWCDFIVAVASFQRLNSDRDSVELPLFGQSEKVSQCPNEVYCSKWLR